MAQSGEGGAPLNPNIGKREAEIAAQQEAMAEAREAMETQTKYPPGYVECRLSTKGMVGAPEVFHIRNLSTEDLLNLGLSEQEDLPIRVVKMLDEVILEEDVSVKDFHDKEVTELLLFIYEAFYTDTLTNLDWQLTEEDWEFLAERCGGRDTDEFKRQEHAYNNGIVKPKFDISLVDSIEYYEADPNMKFRVRITKKDGFTVLFGIPKFGDVMTLKFFVEHMWREKDKQFASIADTLKFRRDAEERVKRGENINLRSIPNIPKAEYDKFKAYELEKSIFAMTAIKAYHLEEFNGKDVRKMPMEEKIKLAADPRIDHSTFEQVQKHFTDLKFGIKEEITVRDPILERVVKRTYSFQLIDLLQAIRDQRPNDTTFTYE